MKMEFEVTTSGVIRTIYSDEKNHIFREIAEETGSKTTVKRASNVEWEEFPNGRSGWTVRAAWNPNLAIRYKNYISSHSARYWMEVSEKTALEVIAFDEREIALEAEKDFFFDLLPKESK